MKIEEIFEDDRIPKHSRKRRNQEKSDREIESDLDAENKLKDRKAANKSQSFKSKYTADTQHDGKQKYKGKEYSKWVYVIDADDNETAERVVSKWETGDNHHSKVLKIDKGASGPRKVRFNIHFINSDNVGKGHKKFTSK